MEDAPTILLAPRFPLHSSTPPSISLFLSLKKLRFLFGFVGGLIWEFLRHLPILQLLLTSEITAWPIVLSTLSIPPFISAISLLSLSFSFNLLFFSPNYLQVCSSSYESVLILFMLGIVFSNSFDHFLF